jgi:cell division topological specificity factor
MIDFFKKMFKPEGSSATARERLRLVLLSDHLSLAPDVVDALRGDLIAVISKYCEVDEANCDVTFEQQDRSVAMLANIPILAVRSRPTPPPPAPRPPAPSAPEPPAAIGGPATASAAVADAPVAEATAPKRRRRKRRASTTAAHAAG